MQLSFDAADRLVDLIEASRGPVPLDEAARSLYALRSAPTAIARALLDDVISGDARLAWRGAGVGLADPPGASDAARDCLVRRLRSRDDRALALPLPDRRDRRATGRGAGGRCGLRDARQPGGRAAAGDHGTDRDRTGASPRRPGRGARRPPLPRVRRRRGARRPQRPVRPRLSRPGRRAAHGEARGSPGRRHGRARAAAPRRPDGPLRARASRALLRDIGCTVPSCAGRRLCHGGDPDRAHRARAGARCGDGGRPRRAVGTARPTPADEALPRRRCPGDTRNVRLPRPARAGALRGPGAQSQRPAPLVLLRRAAETGRGGGPRRAGSGRVGVLWERAGSCARRAAASARASPAGERAQHAAGPPRLPSPPR